MPIVRNFFVIFVQKVLVRLFVRFGLSRGKSLLLFLVFLCLLFLFLLFCF